MDLGKVLEHYSWPLIVLVLSVFAIFIFKNQLRQLVLKTEGFKFKTGKREFQIKFGQRVQKARAQAQNIEQTVAGSGVRPSAERAVDYSKQSSRDLVLQSWGALRQTIYSACAAVRIPMTPSTDPSVAVQRLLEVDAIDQEMVSLLNTLGVLGQELTHDKNLTPIEADARSYKQLADIAMDWMMLSVIAPRDQVVGEPSEDIRRRDTVVGDSFSRPQPGSPAATLIGIAGAVKGRQYSVDRLEFNIGSASNNDLSISGDEYVSGHHALLQFDDGSLYIRDRNSRNGTFVNEGRVAENAVPIQPGDRIRMGESILQVAKT